MSFSGIAEKEFNRLTEEEQGTIIELMILFNKKNSVTKVKKRNFPFDMLKDGNEYMADDFDEIPEGFEEYA